MDNQPPETWIVAAPQDTITIRDPQDPPRQTPIGRIPVRFHVYWAGSDRDGAVAGFYWAVTETLSVIPPGATTVPPLPGPKARDYHFTTRTDSTFVFTASEDVSERQHAFFIYAVDDKGRADPTPARFVFSSYDRFPPTAVIDECTATGTEFELLQGGQVQEVQKTYFVTDFFENSNNHPFPRDTVMANAKLHMRWHGVPPIPTTIVTGYRYKLDEPNFNVADSSVHTVSYNTGVGLDHITPGRKLFTLQAVGQSGWRGEATRWFEMNFAPDSWFAGADPNDPAGGWSTQPPPNGGRYRDFGSLTWDVAFRGVRGSMLSVDSAYQLPAARPERKTFFEAYNQRLWVRQERDTVHMNSWLIFPGGGFDRDSPYAVRSNMVIFGDSLKQYPVLAPAPPNGSPIGFRVRVQVKDASGRVSLPSESQTYPVVDPASSFDLRQINGYWGLTTSAGKAYAVIRAEDGNGAVDARLEHQPGGAVGVADRVDANAGSPEDRALRSKVLTFYVNHAPLLLTGRQEFYPRAGAVLTRHPGTFNAPPFNLPASDDDWFDPGLRGATGGTPDKYPPILRWKLAILGKLATCDTCDTCFFEGLEFGHAGNIAFTIPSWIRAGNITVRVRLCDCAQCDALPSGNPKCPFVGREAGPAEGTCVDTDIPCVLTDAGPVLGAVPGGTRPPGPGQRP